MRIVTQSIDDLDLQGKVLLAEEKGTLEHWMLCPNLSGGWYATPVDGGMHMLYDSRVTAVWDLIDWFNLYIIDDYTVEPEIIDGVAVGDEVCLALMPRAEVAILRDKGTYQWRNLITDEPLSEGFDSLSEAVASQRRTALPGRIIEGTRKEILLVLSTLRNINYLIEETSLPNDLIIIGYDRNGNDAHILHKWNGLHRWLPALRDTEYSLIDESFTRKAEAIRAWATRLGSLRVCKQSMEPSPRLSNTCLGNEQYVYAITNDDIALKHSNGAMWTDLLRRGTHFFDSTMDAFRSFRNKGAKIVTGEPKELFLALGRAARGARGQTVRT